MGLGNRLFPALVLAASSALLPAPPLVTIHNRTGVELLVGRPGGCDESPIIIHLASEGPAGPGHRLGVAHLDLAPETGCLDALPFKAGDSATFEFEQQDASRRSFLVFWQGTPQQAHAYRGIIIFQQVHHPEGAAAQTWGRLSLPKGPVPGMEAMPNQHIRVLSDQELEICGPC